MGDELVATVPTDGGVRTSATVVAGDDVGRDGAFGRSGIAVVTTVGGGVADGPERPVGVPTISAEIDAGASVT